MVELRQWEISLIKDGKAKGTIKGYFDNLNEFFNWLKKQKNINEVTLDTISEVTVNNLDNFMYYLTKEKGNAPTTISKKGSVIREFFKYLKKHKSIKENISTDLELPDIPEREMSFLTEDECLELLNDVSGFHKIRDKAIMVLFLNTGLRLSELIKLNLEDVKNNKPIKIIGKGNKERTICLNERAIEAINDWLKIRPNIDNENALFISEKRNRMDSNTIWRMIKINLKRIKREDCTVHSLRHTYCTLMLKNNVDIKIIQKIAGHSSIQTTEKYTHVIKDQIFEAMNKLNIGRSSP